MALQKWLFQPISILVNNCIILSYVAELKDQVCSPGGTTITGVEYLEEKGFRGNVMGAVYAAFCRGKEIGKQE